MNDLTESNPSTIDSREVAEMIGKEHKNLMRDIRGYKGELGELKIEPSDFFTESTYKSERGKEYPCYSITKKGCEFIAHKLTGVKGTEFTAKYINRFHAMEDTIRSNGLPKGKELLALAVLEAQNTILALESDKKLLEDQIVKNQEVITELQPKANYVDTILQSKSLVLTTQISKDYGMSAKAFNKLLYQLGIQYKVGEQWVLYSKYQGCGYVHSRTIQITRSDGRPDVKMQTEWTQKGRLFLYETLKREKILPIIEQ